MHKTISLRKRLAWYMVSSMLLMSLISGSAVYYGTTHEAEEIFEASMVQTARLIDGLLNQQLLTSDPQRLLNALQIPAGLEEDDVEGHEYEDKLFFAVVEEKGSIVIQSPHSPAMDFAGLSEGFTRSRLDGKLWDTFVLPAKEPGLMIIVGQHNNIRREMTEYILRGLVLPLVLLLPIILLLLRRLMKLALKPLQKVSNEVLKQDFRQLKPIVVKGVPQEIDPVLGSLNEMIQNLEAGYRRERRFVSNASHELRNPLAALLINVENALEETNDPELGASLTAMRESIVRLSHLVAQLLEISHLQNPLSNRKIEPVDLTDICREVVKNYQSKASEHNQKLEFIESAGSCSLTASPTLLTSLLSNLVDNAVKYAGAGCRIQVACRQDGKRLILSVDDSGVGVEPQTRDKILERFFRVDDNIQGAGLGLSIVKSIVEAHSAKIELSDSTLGGLCVRIEFPIPKSRA